MTTRNLDALFNPKSMVLVGASNQAGSVGNVATRNLLAGGYSGQIMLVNPHDDEVCGVQSHRSLSALPASPDMAVVATPPRTVAGIISELGGIGCRAAVVITAGLDSNLRAQMLAAARPNLMRIVGPNCLGFLSPQSGINASFSHRMPAKGRLAFVTQSGAIATSIIDWAIGHDIGFSHVLSLGDMSDVDFGDLLDYLALDLNTRAILLYAESVTQARKFLSAGRIAARTKPVIVVKGGRSRSGAKAAASHTGALAGTDAVYDAVFRRAGMLRVDTLRELFDAAETLASGLRIGGERLGILTNGGGLGVLAADALEEKSGILAALSDETLRSLDRALPTSWSRNNPVDVLGDAHGDRYEAALDILAGEPACDAVLVMNCPTGVSDSLETAEAVLRSRIRRPAKPLLGCWMGEVSAVAPRKLMSAAGMPNYETPDEAINAFQHLVEYTKNQRALFETPARRPAKSPAQRAVARSLIEQVLAESRSTLTEPEAKRVLAAYNIPVVDTRIVRSAEEAGVAAAGIGGPVALKILSRQISHKSDVGGVRLDLEGGEAVRSAAEEMLTRVRQKRPDAMIDGFTVQQMVKRPLAQELLLGAVVDPTFGPCLMFGHGGVATEIIGDRCVGLPPLNSNLALDMIKRTRVSKLLIGFRDRPPARLDDIAATLIALSDIVTDLPEIAELDVNPLLADADGVIALDARIVVRRPETTAAGLAIRPYPEDLVREAVTDQITVRVRPIRPEDSAGLEAMVARASIEDLRLRLHGGGVRIGPAEASRLSQIDYDREMALVAELTNGDISGVVRLAFTPDFDSAELAIVVRSDLQQQGLGRLLLNEALGYARSRGAALVWGDVLSTNRPALAFLGDLGGRPRINPADATLTRVEFNLDAGAGRRPD